MRAAAAAVRAAAADRHVARGRERRRQRARGEPRRAEAARARRKAARAGSDVAHCEVNERRGGATLQLQCFFVCLVCFKRGAAVLFGQGSGLNAFKVYISASCLSFINQDTLFYIHAPRATKTHDRTARAADCLSKGRRWTQVILRPGSYVSFFDWTLRCPQNGFLAPKSESICGPRADSLVA